jgi:hypothetical protein
LESSQNRTPIEDCRADAALQDGEVGNREAEWVIGLLDCWGVIL